MPSLEDAILLATQAHKGQKDLAGLPYITHPMRLMSMFVLPTEDDERMVAVLHDVVEDTEITLKKLTDLGYPAHIVQALDALSRRNGALDCIKRNVPLETYFEYIERVALNSLALRVKLADLRDHLDERRVSTGMLSPETKRKYMDALLRLSGGSQIVASA